MSSLTSDPARLVPRGGKVRRVIDVDPLDRAQPDTHSTKPRRDLPHRATAGRFTQSGAEHVCPVRREQRLVPVVRIHSPCDVSARVGGEGIDQTWNGARGERLVAGDRDDDIGPRQVHQPRSESGRWTTAGRVLRAPRHIDPVCLDVIWSRTDDHERKSAQVGDEPGDHGAVADLQGRLGHAPQAPRSATRRDHDPHSKGPAEQAAVRRGRGLLVGSDNGVHVDHRDTAPHDATPGEGHDPAPRPTRLARRLSTAPTPASPAASGRPGVHDNEAGRTDEDR